MALPLPGRPGPSKSGEGCRDGEREVCPQLTFVSGHFKDLPTARRRCRRNPCPFACKESLPKKWQARGRKRLFGGSSSDNSARPPTATAPITRDREHLRHSDGAVHALLSESTTGRREDCHEAFGEFLALKGQAPSRRRLLASGWQSGSIHSPFRNARLEFPTSDLGWRLTIEHFSRLGRCLPPQEKRPGV